MTDVSSVEAGGHTHDCKYILLKIVFTSACVMIRGGGGGERTEIYKYNYK